MPLPSSHLEPGAEQALAWIGALYEIDRPGDGDLARIGELRRALILDALDRRRTLAGSALPITLSCN